MSILVQFKEITKSRQVRLISFIFQVMAQTKSNKFETLD